MKVVPTWRAAILLHEATTTSSWLLGLETQADDNIPYIFGQWKHYRILGLQDIRQMTEIGFDILSHFGLWFSKPGAWPRGNHCKEMIFQNSRSSSFLESLNNAQETRIHKTSRTSSLSSCHHTWFVGERSSRRPMSVERNHHHRPLVRPKNGFSSDILEMKLRLFLFLRV